MALGFFRRRQKMVIIIMVVLMVSFLVGIQGINTLLEKDPLKLEIGQSQLGKLTRGELMSARADLEILANIGMGYRFRYPPWPTELEFMHVQQNGRQAAMAYALLLQEAEHAGIVVSGGDVDYLLAQLGYAGEQFKRLLSRLRAAEPTWTEGAFRGTIRNWLMITKHFADMGVTTPPSEPEVEVWYRNLQEQIKLQAVKLPASAYLDKVADPNDAQVKAVFNRYRSVLPGQDSQAESFGFGYRQLGRASLQYLLVRGDVVARVVKPTPAELSSYYIAHRSEFVRKEPIPSTQPATAPAGTTQPASAPVQYRDVPLSFSEAKEQVIEKLRDQAARARVEELATEAENNLRRTIAAGADPNQVYDKVLAEVKLPAAEALQTVLPAVRIDNKPLSEAVESLAAAAGLRSICYPWGTQDGNTLLPSVKVTVQTEGKALAAVLDEVSVQVKWPKLTWATCSGFKDVLFSVAGPPTQPGIEFFPLRVLPKTPPMTLKEISEDAVLGYAYGTPAGGVTLAQILSTAPGLSPATAEQERTPMIRAGEQGYRLYVMGDRPGQLLWRLLSVIPAHVPASADSLPGLRQEVVKDIKTSLAFQKALDAANNMKRAAEVVGLKTLAEEQKRELITTGLFARREADTFAATVLPELGITTPVLSAHFMPKAFELVPKNVEPGAPEGPPGVAAVPLPILREVLVIQRVDFRPVVRKEFLDAGRFTTAQYLAFRQQQAISNAWFGIANIARRLGYSNAR